MIFTRILPIQKWFRVGFALPRLNATGIQTPPDPATFLRYCPQKSWLRIPPILYRYNITAPQWGCYIILCGLLGLSTPEVGGVEGFFECPQELVLRHSGRDLCSQK